MNVSSIYVVIVLLFPSIIRAEIWTYFAIHNPQAGNDMFGCGPLLEDYSYCAGRVNGTRCEPLLADWCAAMNMSDGLTYMTKHTVVEVIEVAGFYQRTLPVRISTGSELEFKFILYPGWDQFGIDLVADSYNNTVLHVKLQSTNDFLLNTVVNGTWSASTGYFGTYNFVTGTEYALRVVCATNHFQIYMNGALEETLPYQLPVASSRTLDVYGTGAPLDLIQVTYKA